jgi:hypothetical protein
LGALEKLAGNLLTRFRLVATVGLGTTITLKKSSGAAVRSLRPGTYTITVRRSVASPQFPPDGAYEYAQPLDHGGVRRNEDLAATPREGKVQLHL